MLLPNKIHGELTLEANSVCSDKVNLAKGNKNNLKMWLFGNLLFCLEKLALFCSILHMGKRVIMLQGHRSLPPCPLPQPPLHCGLSPATLTAGSSLHFSSVAFGCAEQVEGSPEGSCGKGEGTEGAGVFRSSGRRSAGAEAHAGLQGQKEG